MSEQWRSNCGHTGCAGSTVCLAPRASSNVVFSGSIPAISVGPLPHDATEPAGPLDVEYGWDNPAPGTRLWRYRLHPDTLTYDEWRQLVADFDAQLARLSPGAPREDERLRELAAEVIAAFDSKPDVDEQDHPGGLTKDEVERAWSLWDLRQMKALDALRAALDPEPSR